MKYKIECNISIHLDTNILNMSYIIEIPQIPDVTLTTPPASPTLPPTMLFGSLQPRHCRRPRKKLSSTPWSTPNIWDHICPLWDDVPSYSHKSNSKMSKANSKISKANSKRGKANSRRSKVNAQHRRTHSITQPRWRGCSH
jgi:hypothetical protein